MRRAQRECAPGGQQWGVATGEGDCQGEGGRATVGGGWGGGGVGCMGLLRPERGRGGFNSGVGGGGNGGGRQRWVRLISKNHPSHHKQKSVKQFL